MYVHQERCQVRLLVCYHLSKLLLRNEGLALLRPIFQPHHRGTREQGWIRSAIGQEMRMRRVHRHNNAKPLPYLSHKVLKECACTPSAVLGFSKFLLEWCEERLKLLWSPYT